MSHDHEDVFARASVLYERNATEYQRQRDGSFCYVCGLLGFRLMQRAILERLVDEADPADKPEMASQLARLVTMPMPEHRTGHKRTYS